MLARVTRERITPGHDIAGSAKLGISKGARAEISDKKYILTAVVKRNQSYAMDMSLLGSSTHPHLQEPASNLGAPDPRPAPLSWGHTQTH